MTSARLKRPREVLRLHQHWKHRRTRQSVYISGIYRKEKRVLVISFKDGEHPDPRPENYSYIGFADLMKNYTQMGAYPNAK